MERNSGKPAIGMTKLFVQTTLADFNKPHFLQNGGHFTRFQDRNCSHSGHKNFLRANELRFELRLTIFQKHFDNFLQVGAQFIQRFRLRMRARETRNIADIIAGIGVFFNHSRKFS